MASAPSSAAVTANIGPMPSRNTTEATPMVRPRMAGGINDSIRVMARRTASGRPGGKGEDTRAHAILGAPARQGRFDASGKNVGARGGEFRWPRGRPDGKVGLVLPTIRTPRLRLRAIGIEDVAELYAVFSDPEVVRYWSRPALTELAEAVAMIGRIERLADEGGLLQWGIVRADEDRLLGTCTLADIDLAHQRASLGYALARSAWGQGFAREAVRALISYGFEAIELHRITADVDPRNVRSLRMLKEFGFVREGLQRECYLVGDEWQDSVLLGLLRPEWPAPRR